MNCACLTQNMQKGNSKKEHNSDQCALFEKHVNNKSGTGIKTIVKKLKSVRQALKRKSVLTFFYFQGTKTDQLIIP